jgi:hypothetical protein
MAEASLTAALNLISTRNIARSIDRSAGATTTAPAKVARAPSAPWIAMNLIPNSSVVFVVRDFAGLAR